MKKFLKKIGWSLKSKFLSDQEVTERRKTAQTLSKIVKESITCPRRKSDVKVGMYCYENGCVSRFYYPDLKEKLIGVVAVVEDNFYSVYLLKVYTECWFPQDDYPQFDGQADLALRDEPDAETVRKKLFEKSDVSYVKNSAFRHCLENPNCHIPTVAEFQKIYQDKEHLDISIMHLNAYTDSNMFLSSENFLTSNVDYPSRSIKIYNGFDNQSLETHFTAVFQLILIENFEYEK